MAHSLRLRLEYWKDGDWFVGRLPQVPGVFSQGATLDDLEENIRDAYQLMLADQSQASISAAVETKEIEVPA
jgi:predicted RNase H-like HicB family nuclease